LAIIYEIQQSLEGNIYREDGLAGLGLTMFDRKQKYLGV